MILTSATFERIISLNTNLNTINTNLHTLTLYIWEYDEIDPLCVTR